MQRPSPHDRALGVHAIVIGSYETGEPNRAHFLREESQSYLLPRSNQRVENGRASHDESTTQGPIRRLKDVSKALVIVKFLQA